MVGMDKRLLIFKSNGDYNRCVSYKKNSINTIRTLPVLVHVRPAYASCGQSTYVAIFCEVINSDGRSHCSREKWLPT
jgi:hypothetical protein